MRLKNSPRSRPRLAPPVPPQRALAVVLGLSLGWAQPGHADTGADRCLKSLPRTESALQSICGASEGLIPFRFNGRWGYLDTAGQVRIAPRFEQAQPFSGGLAAAIESREDGAKWGYIDTDGAWAIAPRFDSANPFRSGLASVRIFSGEKNDVGYINPQGEMAIPFSHYQGGDFHGGHALVETDTYVQSFIDRQGRACALPAPPPSLPAGTRVRIDGGRETPERWLATLTLPPAVVSPGGRVLTLSHDQSWRHAASAQAGVVSVRKDQAEHVGLMHESGRWLLPPTYRSLRDFQDGVGIAERVVAAPSRSTPTDGPAPPCPPGACGGEREALLVSAQGKVLSAAYTELRRQQALFVGIAADGLHLLGPRGQVLGRLSCGAETNVYGALELRTHSRSPWTVASSCDGRWWVSSPSGHTWALAEEVTTVRTAQNVVMLRDSAGGVQLYDRAGKPLLNAAMRKQLSGLREAWLTVDDVSAPRAAIRPVAVFATRNEARQESVFVLTPSGRLVRVPGAGTRPVRWEDGRREALGSPVTLSDREAGQGALTAEGAWLLPPQRNQHLNGDSNGWLLTRDDKTGVSTYINARGQRVTPPFDIQRSHPVAPGISWLRDGEDWHVLDAYTGRLRALPGLRGATSHVAENGYVVVRKEASPTELALYTAQGERLTDWLRADDLEALGGRQQANAASTGWVATRRDEAAGTYAMLLSPDGQPLTQWLPGSMEPLDDGRVRTRRARGDGLLTARGQPLLPDVYEYLRSDTGDRGWTVTGENRFNGLLDGEGRWLALTRADRDFSALKHGPVAVQSHASRPSGAIDINGRQLMRVAGPPQPPNAAELPAQRWVATPSPLPAAHQFVLDDAQPANWVVWDEGQGVVARDMLGALRIGSEDERAPLQAFATHLARQSEEHTDLLNAQGQRVARFDGGSLSPNADGRLVLTRELPWPADHPLARAVVQQDGDQDGARAAAGADLHGLVRAADGQVLAEPVYDVVGQLREGVAPVSRMGNLGLIDRDGRLLVHSAWRCGRQAVLLNGKNQIIWPAESRGPADAPCSTP